MASTASSQVDRSGHELSDRVLTIAAAPSGHPYVVRVCAAAEVALLPDPPVAGAAPGVWWPPAVLDPEWIAANSGDADVLHIHFGTESFAPGHLTAVIDAAHAVGWPVVYTAHDLQNPQLVDQTAYEAQLDELVRGADAVVTLTEGAASALRTRWDRDVSVIPHPSVLDADADVPRVRSFDDVRIGVHLKDLRPNVDGPGTVQALLAAVAQLRADGVPAIAEIRMHHRVRDDAARDDVRQLCAADDRATLIEHERLSDAELAIALSRLDVCVLPYRHGTHSGWLELCWDLGVPVAAPRVGYYAQQHPDSVAVYALEAQGDLPAVLARLIDAAESTRAGTPERRETIVRRRARRRESDAAIADAHAALYRALRAERTL